MENETFNEINPVLLPGDHLVVSRFLYTHHGIYVGCGLVIHNLNKFGIVQDTLEKFTSGSDIIIRDHPNARYSRNEIISRAFSLLGKNEYNLATYNCEHFVNWCIDGDHYSRQIDNLLLTVVPHNFIHKNKDFINSCFKLVFNSEHTVEKALEQLNRSNESARDESRRYREISEDMFGTHNDRVVSIFSVINSIVNGEDSLEAVDALAIEERAYKQGLEIPELAAFSEILARKNQAKNLAELNRSFKNSFNHLVNYSLMKSYEMPHGANEIRTFDMTKFYDEKVKLISLKSSDDYLDGFVNPQSKTSSEASTSSFHAEASAATDAAANSASNTPDAAAADTSTSHNKYSIKSSARTKSIDDGFRKTTLSTKKHAKSHHSSHGHNQGSFEQKHGANHKDSFADSTSNSVKARKIANDYASTLKSDANAAQVQTAQLRAREDNERLQEILSHNFGDDSENSRLSKVTKALGALAIFASSFNEKKKDEQDNDDTPSQGVKDGKAPNGKHANDNASANSNGGAHGEKERNAPYSDSAAHTDLTSVLAGLTAAAGAFTTSSITATVTNEAAPKENDSAASKLANTKSNTAISNDKSQDSTDSSSSLSDVASDKINEFYSALNKIGDDASAAFSDIADNITGKAHEAKSAVSDFLSNIFK